MALRAVATRLASTTSAVNSAVPVLNADPNKFFALKSKTLDGKDFDFAQLKGKVTLIRLTRANFPQFNELVDKYGPSGKFQLLAFPANQHFRQEQANGEEIMHALEYVRPGGGYKPNFPMMEKVEVNGAAADPVFVYLRENAPLGDQNAVILGDHTRFAWSPVSRNDIEWNFAKFLVDQDGTVVARYHPQVEPKDIAVDIEALLA